jgi:hypothetical protein
VTDRPPPPVTVVVPGVGEAPGELLAVGPPPEARPPLPRPLRAQVLVVLGVLAAGLLVAADLRGRPEPPAPRAVPFRVPGVTVSAAVGAVTEYVVRLQLDLVVEEPEAGRGDTGGESEPVPLRLLDVTARGFELRPVDGPVPRTLADVGRFSSGRPVPVALPVEAVVVDCSVEVGAQRTVTLSLRRGDGPVGRLVVPSEASVVRELDDLVSRSCRRPRG